MAPVVSAMHGAASPLLVTAATTLEMEALFCGLGISPGMPAPGAYSDAIVHDRLCRFLLTGVGPIAAALSIGHMLGEAVVQKNRFQGIITTGIAGTYQPPVAPLGALVLADTEVYPEYGIVTGHGAEAKGLGFPQACIGKEAIWDTLLLHTDSSFTSMECTAPEGCARGTIVTVAGVSATPERIHHLNEHYTPMAEAMEGFPLALAARQHAIPFVEIRAISNIVGERDKALWDIPSALNAMSDGLTILLQKP